MSLLELEHCHFISPPYTCLDLLLATLDVDKEKYDSHKKTDGAHCDIGDSQEGVLPAQDGRGREND